MANITILDLKKTYEEVLTEKEIKSITGGKISDSIDIYSPSGKFLGVTEIICYGSSGWGSQFTPAALL